MSPLSLGQKVRDRGNFKRFKLGEEFCWSGRSTQPLCGGPQSRERHGRPEGQSPPPPPPRSTASKKTGTFTHNSPNESQESTPGWHLDFQSVVLSRKPSWSVPRLWGVVRSCYFVICHAAIKKMCIMGRVGSGIEKGEKNRGFLERPVKLSCCILKWPIIPGWVQNNFFLN